MYIGDVKNLDIQDFLPSVEDSHKLRQNYSILLGRELVNNLPFFKTNFKDCITPHIPHTYSFQMNQKSTTVSSKQFY